MQYQYQYIAIHYSSTNARVHLSQRGSNPKPIYRVWLCGPSPSPSGQRHLLHICTNTNENKTKPNHVRPKRSGSVESLIRHLLPRWIAREDPPPHTSYPHSSKPLNFSPLFSIFLILHFSTKNFETFRLFQHFSCFVIFSIFLPLYVFKWMNCIEVKM